MGTASEAERALEMEAMRKDDSSWHPCQVSFRWGLRCSLCFPLQFGSRIIVNTKFNIQRIVLCCFFFALRLRASLWKLIAQGFNIYIKKKIGLCWVMGCPIINRVRVRVTGSNPINNQVSRVDTKPDPWTWIAKPNTIVTESIFIYIYELI
jgi:hypothetical protein